MLDEIQSFFEGLRSKPWPNPSTIDHPIANELRTTAEKHRRLALENLDQLEASLLEIYEVGADDPAAIEFFDNVISIIRHRDKSDDDRLREIGKLLLSSRPLPRRAQ